MKKNQKNLIIFNNKLNQFKEGVKITYIDLSHKLKSNIPVYPGDPKFNLKKINNFEEDYSLFKIKGSLHTGTHIDAPYHYIPNGKKVSDLDINTLIGLANIFKLKNSSYLELDNGEIKLKDISNKENKNENKNENKKGLEKIVIINTDSYKNWGDDSYFTNNPYLSKEVAKFFIENQISGIGIDTCSVDKYGKNTIHKLFLKNNVWIVENLTNLNKLEKNKYHSYFIPMNITAEASFVRAFVKNF